MEAVPDRIGGKIQTWQATIRQSDGTKTAVGRCTLTAVIVKDCAISLLQVTLAEH